MKLLLLLLAIVIVAVLAAARFAWPSASISAEADGLPTVHVPKLAGKVVRVSLHDARGDDIPVDLRDDVFRPTVPIVAGSRLFAEAVVRRPGYVGWLRGRTQTVRVELVAPTAHIRERWPRTTGRVSVEFDRPVRALSVDGRTIHLAAPTRTVSLGRRPSPGTAAIRVAAEPWERLSAPTTVTWFPPGPDRLLAPATLRPTTPLRLVFADRAPTSLPKLDPNPAGRWHRPDAHTLVFVPRGYGFGVDTRVRLTLPQRTLTWRTPKPSELRLEQLLALTRYLPLTWTATRTDAARTWTAQVAAASDPPPGNFDWRYPNIPDELEHLWHPGVYTWIVRGAVMQFQHAHHLTVDGFAGHDVWRELIADVLAGRPRQGGYSYVFVHAGVPQSLNLWHDGRVILTSPGNTGIPAAPTKLGTFAVFEHIPVGTMSGTNPDGSHYHDPGVKWISYFNGGEGIHAFNRASFGTPQSLGCVELPEAAAKKVWPYTPIGTLVTVEH
jgi:hypothetical protein